MHSAAIRVQGTNYRIESEPIHVRNLGAEVGKVADFVKQRGGSNRKHEIWPYKTTERNGYGPGYYNRLRFFNEFFLDGIIVSLAGSTYEDSRYYVNPSRRDLRRDLHSRDGVCLRDIDEYRDYEKDRVNGWIEQEPVMTDRGEITLTFEGAVKHLVQDVPEFHAVTGLPKEWPAPRLRLLTPAVYENEQQREKLKDLLRISKNGSDYTRKRAIEEFPDAFAKYPDIFDEVWKPRKKKNAALVSI
jgi:hypothetical protein